MRTAKLLSILACVALAAAFTFPSLAQAGLSFLSRPFGGKILEVIPNPEALPTIPPIPNPCYVAGSYLLALGLPTPGVYVLKSITKVINGTNPPLPNSWALGLASKGEAGPCSVINLIGTSGLASKGEAGPYSIIDFIIKTIF